MRKTLLAISFLALGSIMSSCTNQGASESGDKTSQLAGRMDAAPVNYRLETVADQLDHPWSLAFLPDGNMLVTQRTGKLLHIDADGKKRALLDFNEGENFPPVHFGSGIQAGLFDVVLHPEFETNRLIYISYAAKLQDDTNTLVLMRLDRKSVV